MGPCVVGYLDRESGHSVSRIENQERAQAQILVPLIRDVLYEAGKDFKDLDAIVTTVGPGSFTGLRISLATARALGVALNIPVVGVVTLDALAEQVGMANTTCIVLETKRTDFYARFYNIAGEALGPAIADTADKIIEQGFDKIRILAGNAVKRFRSELPDSVHIDEFQDVECIDPVFLAELIERDDLHVPPEPLYLRGADVSEPKRKAKVLT